MSETAIRVDNLGKRYRIGEYREPYKTLRDSLTRTLTHPLRRLRTRNVLQPAATIWALRQVSFEVKCGEALGVIGRNGAGKSTLLKVLSRITRPTEGYVEIHGRVGSLLEVGTGFHPELTGRENIYLNGVILGMRRAEIARKFDEIVAFAETEKFLDTPVKRYSSGMYVRLAFAVAAHLEPEILVVDEVLAVGDAAFQKKCLGKMSDVAKGGRTVLFVSHNMAAIQRLCSQAILLDRGSIRQAGDSREIVLSYLAANAVNPNSETVPVRDVDPSQSACVMAWSVGAHAPGQHSIISGDDLDIALLVDVRRSTEHTYFGLALWSDDGNLVWAANSHDGGRPTESFAPGRYCVQFNLKHVVLRPGKYWFESSINSIAGQVDRWYASPSLEVLPGRSTVLPVAWQGIVDFDYTYAVDVVR